MKIEPMLAVGEEFLKEEMWESRMWIGEEKFDGVRMLMLWKDGKVQLLSRGGKWRTENYPQFQMLYKEEFEGTVVDGEMVMRKGRSFSLSAIQQVNGALPARAIEVQRKKGWAHYKAFDVIFFKGKDLTKLPWSERRYILEGTADVVPLELTEVWEDKRRLYKKVVEKGGEGIMLKRVDSPYKAASRQPYWIKVKRFEEIEAVLGSEWREGAGRNKGKVGAVLVLVNGRPAGFVGNFTDELRDKLTKDGKLNPDFIGRKVEVRFQPPYIPGRGLRHPRLINIEEKK